jgi:hypothetical protein
MLMIVLCIIWLKSGDCSYVNELGTFIRQFLYSDGVEYRLMARSQSWLLSRVLFDVIPLRLIPTILVG